LIFNKNITRQKLDKDTLSRLYLKERKSIRAIAEITGWSYPVVAGKCKQYGIKLLKSRREKIKIDKPIIQ
jgi:hypothetical protein